MSELKTWKRGKYPAEIDIRYCRFENDMPVGDSIAALDVTVLTGDMVVNDKGFENNIAWAIIEGGTINTIFEFRVTTFTGFVIIGHARMLIR